MKPFLQFHNIFINYFFSLCQIRLQRGNEIAKEIMTIYTKLQKIYKENLSKEVSTTDEKTENHSIPVSLDISQYSEAPREACH